jgi:hypothetical protein
MPFLQRRRLNTPNPSAHPSSRVCSARTASALHQPAPNLASANEVVIDERSTSYPSNE